MGRLFSYGQVEDASPYGNLMNSLKHPLKKLKI